MQLSCESSDFHDLHWSANVNLACKILGKNAPFSTYCFMASLYALAFSGSFYAAFLHSQVSWLPGSSLTKSVVVHHYSTAMVRSSSNFSRPLNCLTHSSPSNDVCVYSLSTIPVDSRSQNCLTLSNWINAHSWQHRLTVLTGKALNRSILM